MDATLPTIDLVEALQHLTAAELRKRIDALEAQAAGLRRLLVSVAAREREAARRLRARSPAPPEEARRAD